MPTSDIISVPTQANQLPLALAIRVPGLQFATEDLPPHAMPTRGFEGLMAALLAPPTLSVPVAPVEPGPPLVTSSTFGSQPQVEPTPSPILETISPLLLSPDPAGQPVAEAATVAVRAPAALPVGLPSVVPLRATPPSSLGDFKRGTTTVHKRVLDNPNLVPKQATPLTQALPVQDLPGPSVLLYAPSLPPSSVSSSPPSESTPTRPPDPLAAVAVVSEFGPIASVLPPTKVLHPQMLPKDTPVRTTHEQDTPPSAVIVLPSPVPQEPVPIPPPPTAIAQPTQAHATTEAVASPSIAVPQTVSVHGPPQPVSPMLGQHQPGDPTDPAIPQLSTSTEVPPVFATAPLPPPFPGRRSTAR